MFIASYLLLRHQRGRNSASQTTRTSANVGIYVLVRVCFIQCTLVYVALFVFYLLYVCVLCNGARVCVYTLRFISIRILGGCEAGTRTVGKLLNPLTSTM